MSKIDPLYVKKGAIVALRRGASSDSSAGPVKGGDAQVQDRAENGRPLSDDEGNPKLIENPAPQPLGVCLGKLDQKGQAPVKWKHDGSWSMVLLENLELVAPAPEDKDIDPVKLRAQIGRENRVDLDGQRARLAELAERLEAALPGFETRVTNLEDALALLRARDARGLDGGEVLDLPTAQSFLERLEALEARRAAGAQRADGPDGFVTRKELADTVASIAAHERAHAEAEAEAKKIEG